MCHGRASSSPCRCPPRLPPPTPAPHRQRVANFITGRGRVHGREGIEKDDVTMSARLCVAQPGSTRSPSGFRARAGGFARAPGGLRAQSEANRGLREAACDTTWRPSRGANARPCLVSLHHDPLSHTVAPFAHCQSVHMSSSATHASMDDTQSSRTRVKPCGPLSGAAPLQL